MVGFLEMEIEGGYLRPRKIHGRSYERQIVKILGEVSTLCALLCVEGVVQHSSQARTRTNAKTRKVGSRGELSARDCHINALICVYVSSMYLLIVILVEECR